MYIESAAAIAAGAIGTWLGTRSRSPWVLPALQVLLVHPLYLHLVLAARLPAAFLAIVAWAAGCSLVLIMATVRQPGAHSTRIFGAEAYRAEMYRWIVTGRGIEAEPWRMLRFHLRQAAAYALAALATANLLSLWMGACLLNQMNFYVASLLHHARRPVVVAVLGWNLWSIIRVLAFILLGVALGAQMPSLLAGRALLDITVPLALGALGLALDLFLKWRSSPFAARHLRRSTDLPGELESPS